MASAKALALQAVLMVLVPSSAFGTTFDGLAPSLDPFYKQLYDKIYCGKGTCKAKDSVIFTYDCECEAGWKRSPIDQVNDNLTFLPCIFPECTSDFSTSILPLPPIPQIPISVNLPDFKSCYFTNCGAGTCKNTSSLEYICECIPGYKNLFNISSYPRYRGNSQGSNRTTLGLEVSDAKVDANGVSQGTSFLPGKFHWMTKFVMSVGTVLWK